MHFDPLAIPLDGRQLIEASAGTGKTHTLTTLVLRHLIERDVPIERILLVTFTRAATAELVERIGQRLRAVADAVGGRPAHDAHAVALAAHPLAGPRVAAALANIDRASIWTIHGFCSRLLNRWPIETGWIDLGGAAIPDGVAARRAVYDAWVAHTAGVPPLLERRAHGKGARKRLIHAATAVLDCDLRAEPDPQGVDDEVAAQAARRLLEGVVRLRRALGPDGAALRALPSWPNHGFDAQRAQDDLTYLLSDLRRGTVTAERLQKFLPDAGDDAPVLVALREALDAVRVAEPQVDAWAAALRCRVLQGAVDRLLKARSQGASAGFGEVVRRARCAVRDPALALQVRAEWPVLLVDEFQDTDAAQWELFDKGWPQDAPSVLIGDPKQAIYGFRNADVFTYLHAAGTVRRRHAIDVNYRSDPGVLDAVNAFFGAPRLAGRAFIVPGIEPMPVEAVEGRANALVDVDGAPLPSFEWWTDLDLHGGHRGLRDLPDRVATEIVGLLERGWLEQDGTRRRLEPSDIAVLTRTNPRALDYAEALRRRGIPVRNQAQQHIYGQPIAPHAAAWFSAMAAPENGPLLRSVLLGPLFERSATDVLALSQDEAGWEALVDRFRDAQSAFRKAGPLAAARLQFASEGIAARLAARPDGRRDLTDLEHLVDLLQRRWGEAPCSPVDLARTLAEEMEDEGRHTADLESMLVPRPDGVDEGVVVVTLHRAKGLEYGVVVLPDLPDQFRGAESDPRFHRDGHATVWLGDVVPPDVKGLIEDEALAESVRLVYVGMTRARYGVRVVGARMKGFARTGLAWMLLGKGGAAHPAAHVASWGAGAKTRKELERLFRSPPWAAHSARPLAPADPRPWVGAEAAPRPPPPAIPPPVSSNWRTGSFSGLVAEGVAEDDGRDVDGLVPPLDDGADGEVRLAAFPAGAGVGTALHAILEVVDFHRPDDLGLLVPRALRDAAVEPHWATELEAALRDVLVTPLGPEEARLCDIAPGDRIVEMPFTLPVRADGFDADALADIFHRHRRSDVASDLRRLEFTTLEGYLRGVVDLVFRWDGRFYVVDHKSNHLGSRVSDYARPRLDAAMRQHHYVLQASLYTVALYRHLRYRHRDPGAAQRIGGIRYLFLRGMHPSHPVGTGVWSDRLDDALLLDLDGLFDAPRL